MSVKAWLQLAGAGVLLALVVSLVVAWRGNVRDQAVLQQQLKTAQEQLTEANARQLSRNATVQKQIALLQKQKAATQKPGDILKALPEVLPLPVPLAFDNASVPPSNPTGATPPAASSPPKIVVPLADLKPLYDTAVACKECQLQLAAAQGDLKDEQTKTATLSRERDDALRVAKGGSAFRRVVRAAKWFVVGAAAGAVAAKLAH